MISLQIISLQKWKNIFNVLGLFACMPLFLHAAWGLNGHGDIHAWGQTIPSYRKYLIKRMLQHTEFPYGEPNLVEYFQENL